MIIIPISHESQTVRRIPLVTIIIMGLCLIIHLFIFATMRQLEKDLEVVLRDMFGYYFQHTYLELDPKIKEIFGISEDILEKINKKKEAGGEDDDMPIGVVVGDEQGELDRLCQKFLEIYEKIPSKQWGYTPANRSFLNLFTYMFIHGGWLHLLSNLYLLYLTGPFVEDSWGKPVFIALYIVTGMLAARMFALHYPGFGGPLIGASGAIAGVMGAFLVKFWKTKIKFFYWIFFFAGTFRAPSWLILPIWVLLEYQSAKFMDAFRLPGGGGVAHWAHVWGFFFGLATALALKFTGVEEKYIKPKVETGVSFQADGQNYYEEAAALTQDGRRNQAFDKLLAGVREFPTNRELVEALWNLGLETDKKKDAAFYFLKLIEHELREKDFDPAIGHYSSLREHIPDASLGNQGKLILADYLITQKEYKVALKLTNELVAGLSKSSPVGFLLQLHEMALRLEFLLIGKEFVSPDEKIIAIMLQHPDVAEQKKAEFRARSGKVPQLEEKTAAAAGPFDAEAQLGEQAPALPPIPPGLPGGGSAPQQVDDNKSYGTAPSAGPAEPGIDTVKIGMNLEDEAAAPSQLREQAPALPPAAAGAVGEIAASSQRDPFRTDAALPPDHIGTPPQRDPFRTDADHAGTLLLKERFKTETVEPGDVIAAPPPVGETVTVKSPPVPPRVPQQAPVSQPTAPPTPQQTPVSQPTPPPTPQQNPVSQPTAPPTPQQAPVSQPTAPVPTPPPPGTQPQVPVQKTVHVTKAVPLGFRESKIVLNIENVGQRTFSLDKVQSVSVARITPHGAQPFFLIDLLMDEPRFAVSCVRTIRLFSPQINFRQFFPAAQSWLQAFVMFAATLLKLGGGKPFPDLASVQLQGVNTFSTINH